MNAEIMILEEDIDNGTMRVSVHLPQQVKRIGIFQRGDFEAARNAIDALRNVDRTQLQMDWYGGRNAFTHAEQKAFEAAFAGLEIIIAAG